MEKWKLGLASFLGGAATSVVALEAMPGLIFWPLAGVALAGGVVALRRKTTRQ